jgi:hypothetical protein
MGPARNYGSYSESYATILALSAIFHGYLKIIRTTTSVVSAHFYPRRWQPLPTLVRGTLTHTLPFAPAILLMNHLLLGLTHP